MVLYLTCQVCGHFYPILAAAGCTKTIENWFFKKLVVSHLESGKGQLLWLAICGPQKMISTTQVIFFGTFSSYLTCDTEKNVFSFLVYFDQNRIKFVQKMLLRNSIFHAGTKKVAFVHWRKNCHRIKTVELILPNYVSRDCCCCKIPIEMQFVLKPFFGTRLHSCLVSFSFFSKQ